MRLIIRVWNLFLGLASRLVSSFERRNPAALLELEKENLRKLIGRFNEGLISHAALSERLMIQVVRLIGSSTFEMESKQILPWDVPMSRVAFGKPQSHR